MQDAAHTLVHEGRCSARMPTVLPGVVERAGGSDRAGTRGVSQESGVRAFKFADVVRDVD